MRNAKTILAAHALLLLLVPSVSLPSSPASDYGGLRQGGGPSSFRTPKLKKSPSPFSALKSELSVDEAIDRVASFRQYFLVGSRWTAETLAVMAGVFSTQRRFDGKHESILGTFGVTRPAAVVGLCNSCFFVGQAAGVLSAGRIGDTLGRRSAVLTSSATISLFAFLTAFSNSPFVFSLLRLLTGFGVGLGGSNCYVLATEFVPTQYHGIAGIGMSTFSSLGMLMMAPMAFYLKDWRLLMLAVALLNVYPVLLSSSILESPRWLLAKGRKAEAKATILRAVAAARHLNPEDEAMELRVTAQRRPTAAQKEDFGEGLRRPEFRVRLVVMAGCWFCTGLVFYGLACNVGSLPGSLHVNQCLFALADLCAIPLQLALVSRLQRRPSMVAVAAMAACALISSARTGRESSPVLALLPPRARLFVAKVSVTAYFALCYLYATELFPTSMRSTAVACCSFAARLGTILAPLLLSALDSSVPHSSPASSSPHLLSRSSLPARLVSLASSSSGSTSAPSSARAVSSFVSSFAASAPSGELLLHSIFASGLLLSCAAVALCLPETKGLGLPQTLQDLRAARRA